MKPHKQLQVEGKKPEAEYIKLHDLYERFVKMQADDAFKAYTKDGTPLYTIHSLWHM